MRPLEIVHVIDKDSPLYDLAAADITKEKFEIIVIMEGTIETSSMTFQARYSFCQALVTIYLVEDNLNRILV